MTTASRVRISLFGLALSSVLTACSGGPGTVSEDGRVVAALCAEGVSSAPASDHGAKALAMELRQLAGPSPKPGNTGGAIPGLAEAGARWAVGASGSGLGMGGISGPSLGPGGAANPSLGPGGQQSPSLGPGGIGAPSLWGSVASYGPVVCKMANAVCDRTARCEGVVGAGAAAVCDPQRAACLRTVSDALGQAGVTSVPAGAFVFVNCLEGKVASETCGSIASQSDVDACMATAGF